MEVKRNLPRMFNLKNNGKTIELTDPGGHMTVDQVLKFYSDEYPEMGVSTVTGPVIENDKRIYSISHSPGTKG